MIGAIGFLVTLLGIATTRWGMTRSVVLDDRGWEAYYRAARRWLGPSLAALGVAIMGYAVNTP